MITNNNFVNLEKVIAELNKREEWNGSYADEGITGEDWERFDMGASLYEFKYRVERDGYLRVYDNNEQFHADFDYDNGNYSECGTKEVLPKIIKKLEDAINKDMNIEDALLEWENNVVMGMFNKKVGGVE